LAGRFRDQIKISKEPELNVKFKSRSWSYGYLKEAPAPDPFLDTNGFAKLTVSLTYFTKSSTRYSTLTRLLRVMTTGVREGILLGGRKKIALKITICPKNRQLALKISF